MPWVRAPPALDHRRIAATLAAMDATYRSPLPPLKRLALGTMELGGHDRIHDDVAVVRAAMEAGLPIHTSRMYRGGQTLNVVKLAFREAPSAIPPLIAKIYCYNATQMRLDVEEILDRLHLDRLPIAQIATNDHRRREIVDDVLAQGPMYEALCELSGRGLVGHWTFEIFQKFTADARRAVEHRLFDSASFYFNALERETDAETWRALRAQETPVIALRGLSGGLVDPAQAHRAGRPGKPKEMPERRAELEPVYARSGCASWPEFSLRFLYSLPQVRTVVVGTGRLERLRANLALAERAEPLPEEVVDEVCAHHDRWAAGRTFDPASPYL